MNESPMPDGRPLRCPSCKATGPISAVRHIAQTRDLTDENGDDASLAYGVEWEYARPISRSGWLNCGVCGHSWATVRELPS